MKKLPGVLYYTAKTRPEDLSKPYPPPITNADRIRAMTDEELASFLFNLQLEAVTITMTPYGNFLNWLKQEVQEVKE